MTSTDVTDASDRVRPLRLLFLNWRDTRNPEGGGSEVYVESVARAFAAAGHEVTLFCAAHRAAPAEEVVHGVRVVRAGTKLGVYGEAFRRVRRGAFGPLDAVIDVQNGVPFLSRWATDVPVIVLVHHVHREQWPVVYGPVRSRIGWWIESRLAPRVYRTCQYVAVSDHTRAELVGLGVRPESIRVVRNGTEPPPPGDVSREPEPRLVVLGRLVPHKQVEHVLDAAASLREDYPGLTVAVVGDGWWAEELRSYARQVGVDDIVEFLGFVDEDRKHAELARAWLLALPSLKEGWGLVVMEAASHGVPTVAYRDAGGVNESVVDGVTGTLVHGGTEQFTAAVGALLADDAVRLRMGRAARSRAAAFGWDETARGFAKAVEQVTGRAVLVDRPSPHAEQPAHVHHVRAVRIPPAPAEAPTGVTAPQA